METQEQQNQKQIISLPISEQILRGIPGLGRYVQGEPAARIVWDICNGAINGAENLRQAYNTIMNSPVTNIAINNAHAGIQIVSENAYSGVGIVLNAAKEKLHDLADAVRSEHGKKQTFNEAHSAFKKNIDKISSIINPAEREQSIKDMIENLEIINEDISIITQVRNRINGIADNHSSGVRTEIMHCIIEKLKSGKEITSQEVWDYKKVIDAMAEFSKTEDGQYNFTESFLENSSIEPTINDEESLALELEEADNSVTCHKIFLDFIHTYMPDNLRIQDLLEIKKNRFEAMKKLKLEREQFKAAIKQFAIAKEQEINYLVNLIVHKDIAADQLMTELATATIQSEATKQAMHDVQEEINLKSTELNKITNQIAQTRANSQNILSKLEQNVIALEQTKSNLEKQLTLQKNLSERAITAEETLATQLKQNKANATFWRRLTGVTGLTVTGLLLFILYPKLFEKLFNQLHTAVSQLN
jgi:hypothetical protein